MSAFRPSAVRDIAAAAGDVSLDQISARTGLHKGHLSRLISGKREPRFTTVVRIALAYGACLDDFSTREAA
ncbi:helix-turn-helix domain-containing protein [Kitasatospora sp. NPDC094028]